MLHDSFALDILSLLASAVSTHTTRQRKHLTFSPGAVMIMPMNHSQDIPASWAPYLAAELDKPYMQALNDFLESQQSKTIYPEQQNWYAALEHTNFNDVKVVILGQDPYHGPGQAHGLSFSVPHGQKIPPSLRNIYKELARDPQIDFSAPAHGCLLEWAYQGVLLLNAVLTVEAGKAGSHQKQGWEPFTDAIISALNEHREHIVFLLWGKYAQDKGDMIDQNRHYVLQTSHPSPLSAHRGFLGSEHFSQANQWLQTHDRTAVNWQLSEKQEQHQIGFEFSKATIKSSYN